MEYWLTYQYKGSNTGKGYGRFKSKACAEKKKKQLKSKYPSRKGYYLIVKIPKR